MLNGGTAAAVPPAGVCPSGYVAPRSSYLTRFQQLFDGPTEAMLDSVELPDQVLDAIASVVRRSSSAPSLGDRGPAVVAIDESFKSDGFGESPPTRVLATTPDSPKETRIFYAKRWSASPWFNHLTGITVALENLLHETGEFGHVNAICGLSVPVVCSVRAEDGAWVIMEDVSRELAAWKSSAVVGGVFWKPSSGALELYADLLDRIAELHAKWEARNRKGLLEHLKIHLGPQESKLRRFESLFREWFGADHEPEDSPAVRKAKEAFTAARREKYLAFLSRLPAKTRTLWIKHMQCRNALVSAASDLPMTLLHGDLNWRNIGFRVADPATTFVLIDWEDACLGNQALDVFFLILGPVFSTTDLSSLAEQYYERYVSYGGDHLKRDQWERACHMAIAHYGLCWLPHKSELVRQRADDKTAADIEALVERTEEALRKLAP